MWKKFLASVAIVGLLSTGASALTVIGQGGGGETISYIDNFLVAPATPFDPVDGTATVSFDLVYDADVYAYVMDESWNIVATFANYAATTAGQVSYTWYGRVGNTATGALLSDGEYQVKAFATSAGSILDFDYQDVTLDANAIPGDAPEVTSLNVSPDSFSAVDSESTVISFDVNEGAYLTVEVKDGSDVVRTYSEYDGNDWYLASYAHSLVWDGKTTGGSVVSDGNYTVYVTAVDSDGSDTETVAVEVSTSGVTNDGVIEDFEINPRTDWDPSDEELEIEFELTEDVDELVIEAVKGSEVIEIMDENNADDGDYEEYWDGTDEDGDYVEEGVWTIRVTANGDMVAQTVEVDYYTPEIVTAFVTKSSIDPSEDEFTNLVFEVDEDAIVTVEVYDGTRRELTLMDEEEVSGNRYYAVMWDGLDDDGDDLDDGDYTFKITAENPIDDDIYSTKTLNIELDEDKVSSRKSNATNDYTDPVVFDEDGYRSIEVSYCLDQDAEVYLAVYDGTSTTGTPEIVLLDYLAQSEGCHTVQWDGRDDDGRDLDEGVNSYKLITKIGSYKDTEVGKFAVGNAGSVEVSTTVSVYDGSACYNYYRDLDYLSASNELCQAIAWGTEEGIWHGYPDGTFKPYDVINRAEILKVALETFEVNLFPISGSTEGFSDVDPYAWYMPYVRTAKFYGMFHGYPDGTAKLDQDINRVELLKIILEASAKFTSYEFEDALNAEFYADVDTNGSDWYYAYANTAYHYDLYNTTYVDGLEYLRPGQMVERGEVALLLYRMHKAGLLNE